jgi:hypothetical protein
MIDKTYFITHSSMKTLTSQRLLTIVVTAVSFFGIYSYKLPASTGIYSTDKDVLSERPHVLAQSSPAYLGQWSNGRGETLSITRNKIKFANNKVLNYKDLTKATDGTYFEIQITSKGKINFFQRFLSLKVEGKQMKMTGYDSYGNLRTAKNSGLEVNWYK